MKNLTSHKKIFLIYFSLLCLHVPISYFADIYPSLVFPAFSQAPKIEEKITFPSIDFFAERDNQSIKIDKKQFFSTLNFKHANYFLTTITLKEKKYLNDSNLKKDRQAFIQYSKKKLLEMFPNENFDGMTIIKYNSKYSLRQKKLIDEIENVQKTYINFN